MSSNANKLKFASFVRAVFPMLSNPNIDLFTPLMFAVLTLQNTTSLLFLVFAAIGLQNDQVLLHLYLSCSTCWHTPEIK